jgi:hypothetical protein
MCCSVLLSLSFTVKSCYLRRLMPAACHHTRTSLLLSHLRIFKCTAQCFCCWVSQSDCVIIEGWYQLLAVTQECHCCHHIWVIFKCAAQCFCSEFHSWTVLSQKADVSCLLSHKNVTAVTQFKWSLSMLLSASVAESYSQTVSSQKADVSCLLLHKNVTVIISFSDLWVCCSVLLVAESHSWTVIF